MGRSVRLSQDIQQIIADDIRNDKIIEPLLNEFLETWDGAIDVVVAHRIADIMSQPDRDRSGSWSASGAGLCWRRQELQFLGVKSSGRTSSQLNQIFDNGTWVHYRWQAILMTAGLLDNIEVLVKRPSMRARCSMDGVGTAKRSRYLGSEFGLELKGRNDWEFRRQTQLGVDDKTRLQVDFEFLLSGFDVFVIVNENKNNQDIREWVFYRDDERVREMQKQLISLNKAVDNGRLHPMIPECKRRDRNGEFFKCPFGGPNGPCALSGKWPSKVGN